MTCAFQLNCMVEHVSRTLKEQCAHRLRFETLQHASRIIGEWIGFYNNSGRVRHLV
jgi:putative transposase